MLWYFYAVIAVNIYQPECQQQYNIQMFILSYFYIKAQILCVISSHGAFFSFLRCVVSIMWADVIYDCLIYIAS